MGKGRRERKGEWRGGDRIGEMKGDELRRRKRWEESVRGGEGEKGMETRVGERRVERCGGS